MLGSLTNREIETFLGNHCYAHLGCHANGKTYVVPISYVYDNGFLLGQTREGLKVQTLRENPACCIQVDSIDGIADWERVIAWGTFEVLHGNEAQDAMRKLIDRLNPEGDLVEGSRSPRDVTPGRIDRKPQVNIVYRLRTDEKSGRFETSNAERATRHA
jgi:hypothetical protein